MKKPALLANLFAALLACGDHPDKPVRLDRARILAVRADPPQPGFAVTTTLSTLVYEPPRAHLGADQCPTPGARTAKWSWCPIGMVADGTTNDFRCPFPEAEFKRLYASIGLGEAPPYELGYGETVSFTNPFPAPVLHALCRGEIASTLGGSPEDDSTGKSVFRCDLPARDLATKVDLTNPLHTHPIGFRITVKVEVTPACPDLLTAGFSPRIALYTLHLPTEDSIPVNQNPVVSGIFATNNVVHASGGGVSGAVALAEEPLVTVRRQRPVGLALDIDIATAEHLAVPGAIDYTAVSQTQSVALTRHYEHLSFSWYLEAGEFTDGGRGHTTGYLPTAIPDTQPDDGPSAEDRASFELNTTNSWESPRREDWSHPAARIIVVVRDGRGGVAWTSKQVSLEDSP